MIENHFFFKSSSHSLFGAIYQPDHFEISNDNTGYIVIHPFAEEKKSSQRVLVGIALELCKKGYPVFLFDLFGCGDSEGELVYASVSIWIEDIFNAISFFKSSSNINKICIIGLRLGAYLAVLASERNDSIKTLVLIEPVAEPLVYLKRSLRQKLVKELITEGNVLSQRDGLVQNLEMNNSIDFDGHEISNFFYKDLIIYADSFQQIIVNLKIRIFLVNVNPTGKITREFQKIINILPKNNFESFKVIKLLPFWIQIETPECSELINEIAIYCSTIL